ncbi:rabphilin [Arctopsyche grandis]|uniref:rabphilin n=1 Tax=Arctopsyche grandis TaxID=121162 RepID=UPI00406D65E4
MSYMGTGNRYVCPNDRQLSLRAKLRTGWCVAREVSPLTPAEQAAILEVVKRSEALGDTEARRVGRMVERVESLRRSSGAGAVALGGTSGGGRCGACGRRGPLLPLPLFPGLRRCSVCNRQLCSNCALDTGNKGQWLCNICAEMREMWKKSGAWFYKGLPKYILPERKGNNRYSDSRLAASLQDTPSTSSTEPTVVTSDDLEQEPNRLMAKLPSFSRQGSATESHKSLSILQENSDQDTNVLQHGMSGLSLNRMESFSQKSFGNLRRTPSRSSSRSSVSTSSAVAQSGSSGANGSLNQNGKLKTSNGSSNQTAGINSHFTSTAQGVCGTAEVRLQHDAIDGTLCCTAVRARGLPSTDLAGLADPYCSMEVLPPDGTCFNRQRTKTVHKTKNPEFNETVTFYGITEADIKVKTFRITLFDEDKYGCDILGSASITLLDALGRNTSQDLTLPLCAESDVVDQLMKPQILISLSYNTKKRSLAVIICRCRNLPAMDNNGFSDPFVKLHLDPDPYHRKHKTSIKWRNLNPVFNEEFLFETRPTELAKQCLALTVWDKDYGKANDFLGGLVIGASSKGKRLKHWLDCIKFPDHKHEQWHCLTEKEP